MLLLLLLLLYILATETPHNIYIGTFSAPSFITYNDAVKTAADIEKWQRKWDHDVAGFYTEWLIPETGRRVSFSQNRGIGISYSRLLLHDTTLRDDSHRTGAIY